LVIKDSLVRLALNQNETPSDLDRPDICLLCPTRWTVRGDSLNIIFENYSVLFDTFYKSLESCSDTEMKYRIAGVVTQMKSFKFYFEVKLGQIVFGHCQPYVATFLNNCCRRPINSFTDYSHRRNV